MPARWVERKATKKLGARSVLVPGGAWQVCTDQQCPRAGTDHAADLPRTIGSTELAAYTAAVQELEIAA